MPGRDRLRLPGESGEARRHLEVVVFEAATRGEDQVGVVADPPPERPGVVVDRIGDGLRHDFGPWPGAGSHLAGELSQLGLELVVGGGAFAAGLLFHARAR